MGQILPYPKFKAIDAEGVPLSGGKVYTYETGTTTAKASYTDYACTSEAANPVILDSNGEAAIYLSGQYRIVLKTSADATVWTLDNVEGMASGLPAFSVHKNSTNQAITASTDTKLTWSTELFDVGSCFASNKFTPNVAGYYYLSASVWWVSMTDAKTPKIEIYKNGALYQQAVTASAVTGAMGGNISVVVYANGTTDYFEVYVWHNDTGSQSVDGGVNNTWFSGAKIA